MTASHLGLVCSLLALSLVTGCSDDGPGAADGSAGSDGGSDTGGTDGGTADDGIADGTADDSEGPGPGCGNGELDEDEACDGQDFGGLTCADFGGEIGSLSCDACQIDSSECALQPATEFGGALGWSLPEGGDGTFGFYALAGTEWDDGDQSWAVTDMTGDGRPDLVITNENGQPIIGGGDPFWYLYPGTDDGFGDITTWALPEGGDGTFGFYAMAGTEWDDGDQSWAVTDLTGDGLPDLVITNENGQPIIGGGDPFWYLYPNTGSGFGDVTTWALPEGGDGTFGFYAMAGTEWDDGDQSWAVTDMTGDGLPDLVITNEDGQPIIGGGDQFWYVHPNTGSGFGERTAWDLPSGGDGTFGFYALAGTEWDDGDQSWAVTDMTGDGLPDLVITNENGQPIMGEGNQFWFVHENGGSGFGDATTWGLPEGGDGTFGFYALAGTEWDDGDQSWAVTDLTGDGLPDLIITNENGQPIVSGEDQYWYIHPNTGGDFGDVGIWGLPPGGDGTFGFYALAGTEWDDGDQSWAVADMTGDGRPDLVVTNEDGQPIAGPSWRVYPGVP